MVKKLESKKVTDEERAVVGRLKELRLAYGLSQEEMSYMLGASPTYWRVLESRKNVPGVLKLSKIVSRFHISLASLFGTEEEFAEIPVIKAYREGKPRF